MGNKKKRNKIPIIIPNQKTDWWFGMSETEKQIMLNKYYQKKLSLRKK